MDGTIKCLLLDFDSRLGQFFIEGRIEEWCWYNMFNHHFFGGDKSRFFLCSAQVTEFFG